MTSRKSAADQRDAEAITSGVHRIGSVARNATGGFDAFDENDALIDTYQDWAGARRAVFEAHRGEGRRP